MTKPQKASDTISSPRASSTNTAPAMNKSVPHTSPDWRYSIRAATSPPPSTAPGSHLQPKYPEEHQGSGDEQEYAEEGIQSDLKFQSIEDHQSPSDEQARAPHNPGFEMWHHGYSPLPNSGEAVSLPAQT